MEQRPATLEGSTTVHRAVSSDKQLGRYSKNRISITEVKAISLAACKIEFLLLDIDHVHRHGRGTSLTRYMRLHERERPCLNRMEIHRWCAGDRTANSRARVPFTRNETETSPFLWRLLYNVHNMESSPLIDRKSYPNQMFLLI